MADNADNNNVQETTITITPDKNTTDSKEEQLPKPIPIKSLKLKQLVLPVALVTFLLSLPLLFQAIWLFYVQQFECEGLLNSLPRLQIGVATGLILAFFISNGVVYLRVRFPAPGLILVMFPLVVMCIVGLSFGGSFKMETGRIPASPWWLNMKVNNNGNWNSIKSCLYDFRICRDFEARSYNIKYYEFTTAKLTPLEAGCCEPPSTCEMEYMNTTYWNNNDTEMDVDSNLGANMDYVQYDEDCALWKKDETILCYDCHQCRDGFVKILEGKWLKLGIFLTAMSVLLMISHLFLFVGTMLEQNGG